MWHRSESGAGRHAWRRPVAGFGLVLALAAAGLGTGCSTVGYLAQSAQGHFRLLGAARPVDDWLAASDTPPDLRKHLLHSQQIRRFAVRELGLPNNRSYTRYADLRRPAAVWNVVAAPELSMALRTWCFPVVGCVAYRGYFSAEAAEAAAGPLRAEGLDVTVYPVPAYSTLGWGDWLGGDPLLNTFVSWPEPELARMVFHELAHQVVYLPGDTVFNESYATAVERLGLARWLTHRREASLQHQVERAEQRRSDFRALTGRYRAELLALYQGDAPAETKRLRKQQLIEALQADYQRLKAGAWQGWGGYDGFMARVNNASLAMQAAYHQWVPAFEALFVEQGGDFARFHRAVAQLAQLSPAQRQVELARRMPPRAEAGP